MKLKKFLKLYTYVEDESIKSQYDGSYLCNVDHVKDIKFLATKEITYKLSSNTGYSFKDDKFYGWGHRAIFGFSIGDKVTNEDVAYKPEDKYDMINSYLTFFDAGKTKSYNYGPYVEVPLKNKDEFLVTGLTNPRVDVKNHAGNLCIYFKTTNYYIKSGRPAMSAEHFIEYPETWGKGPWTAKTRDDIEEMAHDFADNIE